MKHLNNIKKFSNKMIFFIQLIFFTVLILAGLTGAMFSPYLLPYEPGYEQEYQEVFIHSIETIVIASLVIGLCQSLKEFDIV